MYNCDGLRDLSCLQFVSSLKRISLSGMSYVSDITMLGHLNYISVNYCPIQSLKGLGSVRKVELFQCFGVVSLTGLESNRSVTLYYCYSISDFSPLYKFRKVSIGKCSHFNIAECEGMCGIFAGYRYHISKKRFYVSLSLNIFLALIFSLVTLSL
jgi:hypothetical protein